MLHVMATPARLTMGVCSWTHMQGGRKGGLAQVIKVYPLVDLPHATPLWVKSHLGSVSKLMLFLKVLGWEPICLCSLSRLHFDIVK